MFVALQKYRLILHEAFEIGAGGKSKRRACLLLMKGTLKFSANSDKARMQVLFKNN